MRGSPRSFKTIISQVESSEAFLLIFRKVSNLIFRYLGIRIPVNINDVPTIELAFHFCSAAEHPIGVHYSDVTSTVLAWMRRDRIVKKS